MTWAINSSWSHGRNTVRIGYGEQYNELNLKIFKVELAELYRLIPGKISCSG